MCNNCVVRLSSEEVSDRRLGRSSRSPLIACNLERNSLPFSVNTYNTRSIVKYFRRWPLASKNSTCLEALWKFRPFLVAIEVLVAPLTPISRILQTIQTVSLLLREQNPHLQVWLVAYMYDELIQRSAPGIPAFSYGGILDFASLASLCGAYALWSHQFCLKGVNPEIRFPFEGSIRAERFAID